MHPYTQGTFNHEPDEIRETETDTTIHQCHERFNDGIPAYTSHHFAKGGNLVREKRNHQSSSRTKLFIVTRIRILQGAQKN